jgi:hypothetical protein
VLLGTAGFVALQVGNDFYCSRGERKAMSEFPHFDCAEVDWESNFKITGGCTTSHPPPTLVPRRRNRARRQRCGFRPAKGVDEAVLWVAKTDVRVFGPRLLRRVVPYFGPSSW